MRSDMQSCRPPILNIHSTQHSSLLTSCISHNTAKYIVLATHISRYFSRIYALKHFNREYAPCPRELCSSWLDQTTKRWKSGIRSTASRLPATPPRSPGSARNPIAESMATPAPSTPKWPISRLTLWRGCWHRVAGLQTRSGAIRPRSSWSGRSTRRVVWWPRSATDHGS